MIILIIHESEGTQALVSLIVVNCLILGRQKTFASGKPTGLAVMDSLGMNTGLPFFRLSLGTVREILGNGFYALSYLLSTSVQLLLELESPQVKKYYGRR